MPFGLANAPATFQAYINEALADLVDVICVVYLDDILIYSDDPEDHQTHVSQVLDRLREKGLYAKPSKCVFSTKEVEFLGFIVNTEGVVMEPSRIETIRDWPVPTSFREVQVFLGFANFYRRFVSGYSAIARPLTGLLKGSQKGRKTGVFTWETTQQKAFDQLKTAFTTAPVLIHFDPTKPIRVETDASGVACGGVLSQPNEWPAKDGRKAEYRPVAFWSRKFSPAEMNYGTPDQELMAIVKCFEHWRHYLEGSQYPVEVLTDHNNLRHFMTTSTINRRQARWALELSAYDFEINYQAGKLNPADGPSRRPDYGLATARGSEMLPTLQRKLRAADKLGLFRDPGKTSGSTADNGRNLRVLYTRFSPVTAYNHASVCVQDYASTEALESPASPDQAGGGKVLIPLESGTSLWREDDDSSNAGQSIHEYFVPRALVAKALESETAYTLTSNSLLPLLIELQKGDALAAEKGKAGEKEQVAGVSGKWKVDSNGLLRYQGKAYVPPDMAVRGEIMKICHDDPLSGHFGQRKTLTLVRRRYYWPTLDTDVREYVKGCDICQRVKAVRHRKAGEMLALPLPSKPFESISMDFITDLPPSIDKTTGVEYDSILVVVDRYTKVSKYIPCKKTTSAEDLADLFLKNWFKDQGLPANIISDRGSVFTSKFWSALCYHLRIRRGLSTAFHPQTDGQTERQNQVVETWLRAYVCYMQDDWNTLLPMAEFAYNNAPHDSIGISPNEARYGITLDTRQGIEADPPGGEIPHAKERAESIIKIRKELENSWRRTKESQAKWYNKNHIPVTFKEKDKVLLSSKNIKTIRSSQKLDHRFLGPFEIIKKIGTQAYQLQLPTKYSRIHDVFHVSLLEPYHRQAGSDPAVIQPDLVDENEEYEVEQILARRTRRNKTEWLVRWTGYSPAEDQWLTEDYLEGCWDLIEEFNKKYPDGDPGTHRKKIRRPAPRQ
jgi:transposase InsO family protein